MDKKQEKLMPKLGLIGRHISYSFSKAYFTKKFANEGLNYTYENFDIENIFEFPLILKNNPDLVGLNVTIPYKEQVMNYLDDLSVEAKDIGAANTIAISPSGKLKGYNTDCYGFKTSLQPLLNSHHKTALILGTGGASKAVAYTLKELNIDFEYVSRTPHKLAKFRYSDLTERNIKLYHIIINCTPVGTHPNVEDCPDIPYTGITKNQLLYDLVYNPQKTEFLKRGEERGATICNGLNMLELQAQKAWEIWNLE